MAAAALIPALVLSYRRFVQERRKNMNVSRKSSISSSKLELVQNYSFRSCARPKKIQD
jgi:hypothetical protein